MTMGVFGFDTAAIYHLTARGGFAMVSCMRTIATGGLRLRESTRTGSRMGPGRTTTRTDALLPKVDSRLAKKDGVWHFWDEEGRPEEDDEYVDGVLVQR